MELAPENQMVFTMKKHLYFIVFFILVSASSHAQKAVSFSGASKKLKGAVPFLKPSLFVDLQADSNAVLILRVESAEASPIHVRVTEKSTGLVHEKFTRDHQYAVRLRFDNSIDGIFDVVVQCGRETWKKTVTLQTNEVITRSFIF